MRKNIKLLTLLLLVFGLGCQTSKRLSVRDSPRRGRSVFVKTDADGNKIVIRRSVNTNIFIYSDSTFCDTLKPN